MAQAAWRMSEAQLKGLWEEYLVEQKSGPTWWYNYVTREHEYRASPTTDEEALELLPQHYAAKSLYSLCREHRGLSVLEAMKEVLEAVTSKSRGEAQ